MVYQLIYNSAATRKLTSQAVQDISKCSAAHNLAHDITGILLLSDGAIFQVLEGEKSVVKALCEKISQDERHVGMIVMVEHEIKDREFTKFSIGFQQHQGIEANDNFFPLTRCSLRNALPRNPSIELNTLAATYLRVSGLA